VCQPVCSHISGNPSRSPRATLLVYGLDRDCSKVPLCMPLRIGVMTLGGCLFILVQRRWVPASTYWRTNAGCLPLHIGAATLGACLCILAHRRWVPASAYRCSAAGWLLVWSEEDATLCASHRALFCAHLLCLLVRLVACLLMCLTAVPAGVQCAGRGGLGARHQCVPGAARDPYAAALALRGAVQVCGKLYSV